MSVAAEFTTLKELILQVLRDYPETRSSDNKLFIQCAKKLGAETLDDLSKINLNLISLHKIRQKIQNKEGLYLPDKVVQRERQERHEQIKLWMVN